MCWASWFECSSRNFFGEAKNDMVAPYSWKMVLNIMLERGTVLIDSFNKHLFNTLHVLGTAVNKSRHHPSLPHRAARIPKLPWMEYGRGHGLSSAFSPAPLWNSSCPQVPLVSFKTLSFLSLFTWVTQNSHLTCLLSSRLIVFKPSSSLLQSTNLTMPLSYLIVHLVSVNTRRKLILHSMASLALPYVTTACCPVAFPAFPSTNFSCPQHLWFLKDRHILLRAWTLHPPFC